MLRRRRPFHRPRGGRRSRSGGGNSGRMACAAACRWSTAPTNMGHGSPAGYSTFGAFRGSHPEIAYVRGLRDGGNPWSPAADASAAGPAAVAHAEGDTEHDPADDFLPGHGGVDLDVGGECPVVTQQPVVPRADPPTPQLEGLGRVRRPGVGGNPVECAKYGSYVLPVIQASGAGEVRKDSDGFGAGLVRRRGRAAPGIKPVRCGGCRW